MEITIELLEKSGFYREKWRNPNNESDSRVLLLYRKGEIAVGYDYGWGIYEMGHGIPTFTYPIQTWEDLIDGMSNRGLAIDMSKQ